MEPSVSRWLRASSCDAWSFFIGLSRKVRFSGGARRLRKKVAWLENKWRHSLKFLVRRSKTRNEHNFVNISNEYFIFGSGDVCYKVIDVVEIPRVLNFTKWAMVAAKKTPT